MQIFDDLVQVWCRFGAGLVQVLKMLKVSIQADYKCIFAVFGVTFIKLYK